MKSTKIPEPTKQYFKEEKDLSEQVIMLAKER